MNPYGITGDALNVDLAAISRWNAGIASARADYNANACGTRAGYMRHRRDDEDPCPDCRAADTQRPARGRKGAKR